MSTLPPETHWIFLVGASEVMTVTILQYNFPFGRRTFVYSISYFI